MMSGKHYPTPPGGWPWIKTIQEVKDDVKAIDRKLDDHVREDRGMFAGLNEATHEQNLSLARIETAVGVRERADTETSQRKRELFRFKLKIAGAVIAAFATGLAAHFLGVLPG